MAACRRVWGEGACRNGWSRGAAQARRRGALFASASARLRHAASCSFLARSARCRADCTSAEYAQLALANSEFETQAREFALHVTVPVRGGDDFALDFALLRVDFFKRFFQRPALAVTASSMACCSAFGVRAGEHLH